MLKKLIDIRQDTHSLVAGALIGILGIMSPVTSVLAADATETQSLSEAQVKQAMKLSLPTLDGTLKVSGLEGQVSIFRDSQGNPTVKAGSRIAAIYGMGFLHGQDRFFLMDLLRRISSGELSALVGSYTLDRDKANRLFLLREKAQTELKTLPKYQLQLLKAYTAGVNAGLHQLKHVPFEYTLLHTKPQPWRPEDTLLVVASLYFDSQDNEAPREYVRGWIKNHSTPEQTKFLLPEASKWDVPLEGMVPSAPVIPEGAKPDWWGKSYDDLSDSQIAQTGQSSTKTSSESKAEEAPGSNGWIIQRQGKVVLSNDKHLSKMLPNLWYKMSLKYPSQDGQDWRISGDSLPGTPTIISGSNGYITWGMTNGYVDTFDWVKVTDPGKTRVETIKVNQGKDVKLKVHVSDLGPVVQTKMGNMAMHWVISQPGAFNLNFMQIIQSHDIYQAMDVANRSGIPAQNLLVADTQGNIGWTLAGALPNRVVFGQDNTFPLDDSEESSWWPGVLPAMDYPRVINPESGVIVAANNRLLFTPEGDQLGDGGFDPSIRAYSIAKALSKADDVSVKSMYKLQFNNTAYLMQDWSKWLLSCLGEPKDDESARHKAIRAMLHQWDGTANKNSTAYALLASWRDQVYSRLFAGLDSNLQAQWSKATYNRANRRWDETVRALMNQGKWVPDGFKDWKTFSLKQLDEVWTDLDQGTLTWGDLNQSYIGHPLSTLFLFEYDLPFLNDLLNAPSVPLSGDNNMIHVNRSDFGASDRQVISPGDDEHAILSMPTGSSGDPLSPWWFGGLKDWNNGVPHSLLPGKTAHQLILQGTSKDDKK
jgi:penicillin amidase